MGVTGHDGMEPRRRRIDVELRKVVNDADDRVVDLQDLNLVERRRPRPRVVVPSDRGHGRNAGQSIEDPGRADVAGVHDELAATQGLDRLRSQQAMRVGDQTDATLMERQSQSRMAATAICCTRMWLPLFRVIHRSSRATEAPGVGHGAAANGLDAFAKYPDRRTLNVRRSSTGGLPCSRHARQKPAGRRE